MIISRIEDATGSQNKAEVTEDNALSVASRPYWNYSPQVPFFTNDTYFIDLNNNWSNVAPGNSNELIHDGTDTVAWTGSVVSGAGWTIANTNNPFAGSKNISVISGSLGSTIQANRGSNVTMGAHTGIQMSVDVTDMGHPSAANLDFYAWNTASGIVGNSVDIYDYTGGVTVGYVTFTIPLADMGLTTATYDAVRFQITGRGGAIVDIDNIILLDPTGGAAIGTTDFEMAPSKGNQWNIDSFVISMADAYAATVANGTLPSLPYDGFLGESKLGTGILFRVFNNIDDVTFAANFRQLMDFMQFGEGTFTGTGSDGINSWFSLKIMLPAPITLNADEKDKMQIRLSDDLTGLLWFRWSANVRQRPINY